MELTEPIETLNAQLAECYGFDIVTGKAIFRIVFSDDQFEKRLTEYDDRGNQLLMPEIRELPKYRQWIQGKYLLERYMIIDNLESQKQLAGAKTSYECIFVFEDAQGNALPPRFDVCEIVITTMNAAMAHGGFVKYHDDNTPEKRKQDIEELQKELFGNENDTTDALAVKEGIVVPPNYGVKN